MLEEQREADRKKSRRQLEEEAARKRRLQMAAKHAPTATSFKGSELVIILKLTLSISIPYIICDSRSVHRT